MRLIRVWGIFVAVSAFMVLVSQGPRESVGQAASDVVSGVINTAPAGDAAKSDAAAVYQNLLLSSGLSGLAQQNKYNVANKVDPFAPLVQEVGKNYKSEKKPPVRPKRALTPLEKMELSQVKLVAIVITPKLKLAMVEEPMGKGYEVRVGTFIGKNGGQVSAINPDAIRVKEHVMDNKGQSVAHYQEIKLRKGNDGE